MPRIGIMPTAARKKEHMVQEYTGQDPMLACNITSCSWDCHPQPVRQRNILLSQVLGATIIKTPHWQHHNSPTTLKVTVQLSRRVASKSHTATRIDTPQDINHISLPLTSKRRHQYQTTTRRPLYHPTLISPLLYLHHGLMSNATAAVCHLK